MLVRLVHQIQRARTGAWSARGRGRGALARASRHQVGQAPAALGARPAFRAHHLRTPRDIDSVDCTYRTICFILKVTDQNIIAVTIASKNYSNIIVYPKHDCQTKLNFKGLYLDATHFPLLVVELLALLVAQQQHDGSEQEDGGAPADAVCPPELPYRPVACTHALSTIKFFMETVGYFKKC